MSDAARPALEIALYRVSNPTDFPPLQSAMHDRLSTLPGFVRSERLRSASLPDRFGDVILWSSLETAEAAAEQMQSLPGAERFMGSISEMELFDHAHTTGDVRLTDVMASEGEAFEVVAHEPSDAEAYAAARPGFEAEMARRAPEARIAAVALKKRSGVRADVGVWRDAATAHATEKAVMESEAGSAAAVHLSEVVFFDVFDRIGQTLPSDATEADG